MPVAAARRSTLPGSVASCSNTRSGAHALITSAICVDATAAAVQDVVGEQPKGHAVMGGLLNDKPSALVNSVRYG